MRGDPRDRAEFARTVSINVDGYRIGKAYVTELIERAGRTRSPGGLWLLGEGGVGKSFILDAIRDGYAPTECSGTRICPVLLVHFGGRPAVSSILISILLQLGQDIEILRYQSNDELQEIVVDSLRICGTKAILYDESQHLWLNSQARRVADRVGGPLGDFLKVFYDEVGVAFIFAGTPGLSTIIDTDTQASTRWAGVHRLRAFEYGERYLGLLDALDQAMPMEEPAGLADTDLSKKIHEATKGNFRLLKNFLAESVFAAASEGSRRLTIRHMAVGYFRVFCQEDTPFGRGL